MLQEDGDYTALKNQSNNMSLGLPNPITRGRESLGMRLRENTCILSGMNKIVTVLIENYVQC